jgi:hypothetical protein
MRVLILCIGILLTHLADAQMFVVYPRNRQIFQRNENNEATVSVLGNCSELADKVQVSFVPVKEGQGKLIDWILLDSNPNAGIYQGKIVVKGGWYRMKVRSFQGDKLIDSTELNRVGVGENFLIAGQSNAQGTFRLPVEIGAEDDRVNCSNFYAHFPELNVSYTHFYIGNFALNYPTSTFSQMGSFSTIGPNGLSLHYWPAVGDTLVKKYNVPVCFINAGWGGSSIRNWVESARGVPSPNPWDPTQNYQLYYPYKSFSRSLEIFGQKIGFRAVLWHQGETDARQNMSQSDYYNYLVELISTSRKEVNQDLPWIVAQATRGGGCDSTLAVLSPEIRAAQRQVTETASLPQVFEGPNTDDIEVPRNASLPYYGCVHFSPVGFPFLGSAWFKSIDDAIVNGMKHLSYREMPKIEVACAPDNSSMFIKKINGDFVRGDWTDLDGVVRVDALKNNNVGYGIYQANLFDSLGHEFSIPIIEFKKLRLPKPPSILANSDTLFCSNTSVKLSATGGKVSFVWSTGATTQDITVTKTGLFTVKTYDDLGCLSPASKAITTQVYPLPATPQISTMSPFYLTTGPRVTGISYSWFFNGNKLPVASDAVNLHVKQSGLYQAKFSYIYPKGPTCTSDFSNQINYELPAGNGVVAYPNPASKELFIQSKYDLVGAKYVLYGLDGREMLHGVIDNSIAFVINVSGLSPAIYKLTIQPTNGTELLYKTIVVDYR